MMPYERLDAWKLCHELALTIYETTKNWPREEVYGLVTQARRASFSCAVNIAEGAAKRGKREFRRFLDISLGSLSELSYILLLARDLGYLTRDRWTDLDRLRGHAGRVTWGLYGAMSRE